MAAGAGFSVQALFLSSSLVAGSVSGQPVGTADETCHGAKMGVGDGVIAQVRLGEEVEGRAEGAVMRALAGGAGGAGARTAIAHGRPVQGGPLLEGGCPG